MYRATNDFTRLNSQYEHPRGHSIATKHRPLSSCRTNFTRLAHSRSNVSLCAFTLVCVEGPPYARLYLCHADPPVHGIDTQISEVVCVDVTWRMETRARLNPFALVKSSSTVMRVCATPRIVDSCPKGESEAQQISLHGRFASDLEHP